jgi:FkbM family methyltransferase
VRSAAPDPAAIAARSRLVDGAACSSANSGDEMRPRDIADYFKLRRIATNPWEAVRYRWCGRERRDLTIGLRGASPLRLRRDLPDHHMFHRIFLADEYRLGRLALAEWECVVDLGANVGIFSARVASFVRRVIAYEPIGENFVQLEKNSAGRGNVTIVREAVSSQSGTLRIYAPKNRTQIGVFSAHADAGHGMVSDRYEEVNAVTLDEAFRKHDIGHCDLLKIDVEGHEYDILHAASDETLDRIERIHGEFHDVRPEDPRTRISHFSDFLRDHGFAVCVVPHRKKPNHGMFFAQKAD